MSFRKHHNGEKVKDQINDDKEPVTKEEKLKQERDSWVHQYARKLVQRNKKFLKNPQAPEVEILDKELDVLSKKMQDIDIALTGHTNPDSPSFLELHCKHKHSPRSPRK